MQVQILWEFILVSVSYAEVLSFHVWESEALAPKTIV